MKNKTIFGFVLLTFVLMLSSFASASLTEGLLHYYKSDVDGEFNDSVGTGDGVLQGTPTFTSSGLINGAYDFNPNDFIRVYEPITTIGTGGKWSFSFWFKSDDIIPSSTETIFSYKNGSHMNCGYQSSNSFQCNMQTSSNVGKYVSFVTSDYLNSNEWYHIVYTGNGTTQRIFVNGVEPIYSQQDIYDGTMRANTQENVIGKASMITNYFNGVIDEMGIWDRAIIEAEIISLNNSGNGLSYDDFVSSNDINLTVENTSLWNQNIEGTCLTNETISSIIINNTDFTLTTGNNSNYSFEYSGSSTFNVSVTITCTNDLTFDKTVSTSRRYDEVLPVCTGINNEQIINSTFLLNFSCSDDLDLNYFEVNCSDLGYFASASLNLTNETLYAFSDNITGLNSTTSCIVKIQDNTNNVVYTKRFFGDSIDTFLETNVCPSSIAGQMSLWLVTGICLFFIMIAFAFQNGYYGLAGSIGLIFLSLILIGCVSFIGYIVLIVGLVSFLGFAFTPSF